MINTVFKKRAQVSTFILVLSVFLTVMTASAATETIRKGGGTIEIASGVSLFIPKAAIPRMRVDISADMYSTTDSIEFVFGPSPMRFDKDLTLKITWEALEDLNLDGFTLYGPRGKRIEPANRSWGLAWKIRHFSLYYYRRR